MNMKEQMATQEVAKNKAYLEKVDNKKSLNHLLQTAENYRNGIRKELWPTGFMTLDSEIDGGFQGSQLVVCGAISSLGKSSFCLQMATQMAEQGKDVLIFSLEMSCDELNAKIVSRYSYMLTEEANRNHAFLDGIKTQFTTNEILKGDVSTSAAESADFFERSVEKAMKVSDHVYIYVGNNDVSVDKISMIANRHYLATGRKPAIFVDYLQILTPNSDAVHNRYDARRSTNDDITKLKVLAREMDVPVVVISAFNRASYTDPVSMSSFRESSGIEYSADILIGLQYKGMEYFTENSGNGGARETDAAHNARVQRLFEKMQSIAAEGKAQLIELKLLKNRNGARSTLEFDFTPKYNFFEPHGDPTSLTESDFHNPRTVIRKSRKL